MPIPETLSKIKLAGDVRHPQTGAPGTGRVEIEFGYAMRDLANNIIFGPGIVTATVTDGVFETAEFVNPRQAGVSPTNQPLTVRVLTDVHAAEYQIEIPADSTGTVNFTPLTPAENPPAVVIYALASQLADYLPRAGGTLTGAVTWNGTPSASGQLTPKSYVDGTVAAAPFLPLAGGTVTGAISWNGTPSASGHLVTKAYVDSLTTGGGAVTTLPLFDVEDYGAVGDGTTDDYTAIRAAWDDMLDSPVGGLLFFPRAVTYRVVATDARIVVTPDEARALFPLPMRSRQLTKLTFGILGVGDAYSVRAADLGSTPGQVATASVLHVDYDTPFGWTSAGAPCVFGAPDADATDPEGNTFSNLHWFWDRLIVRQPDNPSMVSVNIEQVSTYHFGFVRADVEPVLDLVSEPTHPTGIGVLLPRSNNNVAGVILGIVVEGYFGGAPLTEHIDLRSAIVLRCKVGIFTRRPNSHYGHVGQLKIEQCPWGFSGLDPSAAAESAVVPWHGWTGRISLVDIEDYAYNGQFPWLYAPVSGAHLNDPNGTMNGTMAFLGRIDSEGRSAPGIGIGPAGGSQSLYVIGPAGTTASPMAIFGFNHTVAATRLLPPGAPEITEYRLWPATDGPSESVTDGAAINLAVEIAPSAAVEATELHFYRGNLDVSGSITGRLWEITGVGTGTAVPGSDVTFDIGSTTGWKTAEFASPIALDPAKRYAAVVHFPDRWVRTASYWDSGAGGSGIVNGPLRAFSNADSVGGQGKFSSGAIGVYPAISGGGTNYWVDVTVVDA